MFTRGEMIPSEDLRPVPRYQRGQLCLKCPNHWGRLPRRITDQLGRHPQLHLAQFVIHGLVRDAELGRLRLIGGMHAGLDSQDHLSIRSTTDENSNARVYCTSAVRAHNASILSALHRFSNTPRAITQIGRCSINGSNTFPSEITIFVPS